jgi:hypothetical protein
MVDISKRTFCRKYFPQQAAKIVAGFNAGVQEAREKEDFEDLSVLERLSMLSRLGVTNVICAGISQSFHDKLTAAKISPITGIAGEVGEVLSAFICDGLNDPRFYMPGYKSAS